MSTEENKDLVRRLFDAINNQSLDEPDTLLDPDFRLNGEPISLADFQEFVIWQPPVLTQLHKSIEAITAGGATGGGGARERVGGCGGGPGVDPCGEPAQVLAQADALGGRGEERREHLGALLL